MGVLDVKALKMSHEALSQMLGQLRPNAVALVDAFDFPDRVLNSTIGRFDGKVYEALYEVCRARSTLRSTACCSIGTWIQEVILCVCAPSWTAGIPP